MTADTNRPRVGFVGLGIMGAPMVRRLLSQGFQVTVWNL
ncbi:MAG TPA: 2-hydroxy-3-oxopropionate reductase, partial [Citreicella sp.]|nr:2-hydroxy-3-oxopropionate reductase [Citreicella sp.]